jgi:hypothetical protein
VWETKFHTHTKSINYGFIYFNLLSFVWIGHGKTDGR